jgi:hypothetical protein
MANSNFVVHNGLTVGPTTIDAATGAITTTGNITAGNLSVTGNITVTNTVINSQQTGNLTVGIPLNFSAPNANLTFAGTQNNYLQMQLQNQNSGTAASGDYVATANNGSDTQFFIDMGINGSGYSQATPFNASYARDGYLYVTGDGTGVGGGNLMLATMASSNKIFLNVGGQDTVNIIANINVGGITVQGNIIPTASNVYTLGSTTAWWNKLFSVAATAQYADLAENYVGDASYEAGTVVEFGGANEVTLCDSDMSSRVAGVVSTNPAYLMNGSQLGENIVAVALTGRVPTKVRGPIRKGDLIVSAGEGHARAENLPQVGTVIGKALEDFNGDSGVIEVVVGKH